MKPLGLNIWKKKKKEKKMAVEDTRRGYVVRAGRRATWLVGLWSTSLAPLSRSNRHISL
jgi:hypothetical protein